LTDTLPQTIPVQQNPLTPAQSAASIPVTGACSDPYTIRSGDTVSQIAVTCNTTLAVLTQLNPQMTNVNCIYPGQLINIRSGSTVQLPAPCRVAARYIEVAAPADPPAPVEVASPIVALPETCACYTAAIPVSGNSPMIIPGTLLQVTASNFPANTPVNIAIGPRTAGYTVVASGVTASNGSLVTRIIVPTAPDSQTPWAVVVLTTSPSPIQVMSQPFFIGP